MDNGTLSACACDVFRVHPLLRGAGEVLDRHWGPHQVAESHSHPFDADAVVTAGGMWLIREDRTEHLLPGDDRRPALRRRHLDIVDLERRGQICGVG
jgi:hypothetical protein